MRKIIKRKKHRKGKEIIMLLAVFQGVFLYIIYFNFIISALLTDVNELF
jgi:hypothetical protein